MALLVSWRGILFNKKILGVLGRVKPDGLWFCLVNMTWKVFVHCVFLNILFPFCADSWVSYNLSSLLLFHLNIYQEMSLFLSGKVPCMQENTTAKSLLLVNCLKKIDGMVYSLSLLYLTVHLK